MGQGVIAGWLVAAALAGAPEASEDPDPDDVLEVTVWGEAAIRQARSAVSRELADLGYKRGRERHGRVVYRPPRGWMGRVVLDYDGTLYFRRPVVVLTGFRLENPVAYDENPHFDRDPGGLSYGDEGYAMPHGVFDFQILPSMRRVRAHRARVMEEVEPTLREYRAVVERTARMRAEGR